jgi:hypothetical protein
MTKFVSAWRKRALAALFGADGDPDRPVFGLFTGAALDDLGVDVVVEVAVVGVDVFGADAVGVADVGVGAGVPADVTGVTLEDVVEPLPQPPMAVATMRAVSATEKRL